MLFFLLGTIGLGLGYVLNEVFSSDQNNEQNVSLTLDASGTSEVNNYVDVRTETPTFISSNSAFFTGSEADNEFNLGDMSSDGISRLSAETTQLQVVPVTTLLMREMVTTACSQAMETMLSLWVQSTIFGAT